jgi:hypothetical protein
MEATQVAERHTRHLAVAAGHDLTDEPGVDDFDARPERKVEAGDLEAETHDAPDGSGDLWRTRRPGPIEMGLEAGLTELAGR